MSESSNVRRTVVTRTISRKFNTAPYETLDVGTSLQQEIEWTNNEDLWKKERAFDKYVLKDFQEYVNTTLQSLGLQSVQGSTESDTEAENKTKKPGSLDDFDNV